MKSLKERTSLKAKVCEMYANDINVMEVSKALCVSYGVVHGIVQRDYLGVVRSKTPVHVLKESKV